MEQRLNKKLIELKENGLYPFHMPGHKRNIEITTKECSNDDIEFGQVLSAMYDIDITEIDGFDNLHDAATVIKEAQNRAAKLFKSEETHYLVNGSTCGILSAISSVCKRGEKIIVARNCHISVYNAIEINELKPIFVTPKIYTVDANKESKETVISGEIEISSIEKAILSNLDAKAIVITSPTYDGILSDVLGIANLAHEYDIPLIVDEAHGALFYIEGRSAVINKADIVINSLHKTLPALTQTALLHINGNLVDRDRVKKYLRIYQTSSPSYVLMGSIDYAIEIMENRGSQLYRDFCIRTVKLKEQLSKLRNIKYISKDSLVKLGAFDFDESKVLISTANTKLDGRDLYNTLREEYKLQPEMAAGNYVLLMTTIFDTDDAIDRLIDALIDIDDKVKSFDKSTAGDLKNTEIITDLSECISKPSLKTVFAYPPGIPIIVKGEIVTEDIICEIKEAIEKRLDIKSID